MELSVGHIVFFATVFSVAGLIQGIIGFGFTLIAVNVFSFIVDPKTAVPFVVLPGAANCIFLAWLWRKKILYRETVSLLVPALLFIPVGSFFLSRLDSQLFLVLLGTVTVFISILRIVRMTPVLYKGKDVLIAGSVAGLFSGAFGVSGPPLILYANNCHWPVESVKANLQFIFTVLAVGRLVSYFFFKIIDVSLFCESLFFLPLVVIFSYAGMAVSRRLEPSYLKSVINIGILIMGLILLTKAL